ncbi:hypothetical protein AN639_03425 [Candidatus Epulonipiscium fishelsonii]|nr:hypothetical protein AN639_03425 [Epulopiscium sp. SCG-B05WGA-EpuloA1]ONI47343.1 hypothetical protein AN644_00630 [Epulopiscium sp. SCG-C06WGA-EpuloA1]
MIYGFDEIIMIARVEIYNELSDDRVNIQDYIFGDKDIRAIIIKKIINWEDSQKENSIQTKVYKIVRLEMYNEFGSGIIDIDDYFLLSKSRQTRLFEKVIAWENSLKLKKILAWESYQRGVS